MKKKNVKIMSSEAEKIKKELIAKKLKVEIFFLRKSPYANQDLHKQMN